MIDMGADSPSPYPYPPPARGGEISFFPPSQPDPTRGPSPLAGGEAETGKGPVDLFPAERVRMKFAHPGQEKMGWGCSAYCAVQREPSFSHPAARSAK